jgi:arylsulfatase A-like enzyme
MISRLDSYVGRILQLLDELHLADRTLVIFSSDNGTTHAVANQPFHVGGVDAWFFQSTADLRGYKGSLYEGGIRVPTIVRLPGQIPAGTESDHPSYFADWFPTLCQALGLPVPAGLDGVSLWPLLTGGTPPVRERPMVWIFPEYGGQVAVRLGDFKVIRQRLKTKEPGPWEVYHLATDRAEQHNLAEQHPELIARALEVLRRETGDNPVFPVPIPEQSPAAVDE